MSYLTDILEQPQVLRAVTSTYKDGAVWAQIAQWGQKVRSRPLILTGLGASFNALLPLRYYLHQQGLPVLHIETGELIYHGPSLTADDLLVVVSQSGESIEIRRLIECLQSQQAALPTIISVTTQPGNTLAQHSDIALHTQAGSEVGVATKTYTSTLAILHWLGRSLTAELSPQHYLEVLETADQLADCLQFWEQWVQPAVLALQTAETFALVGRGPSFASACNGALIIQESLRRLAGGFTGGQFRHGPMELISPTLGTLIFTLPGSTLSLTQRMAQEVHERGGLISTIGVPAGPEIPNVLLPDLDDWLSPVVNIVAVQLIVAQLAEAVGLTPGQFRWSGKVIQQE